MPEFVHLHLHTDYSLLDGACDVEKLVARAKALNMPAVAVTDHGNIFGAFHFQHYANGRFASIVLKNSVLKPTVIADSFRPVGAGDRIDDGSAAG